MPSHDDRCARPWCRTKLRFRADTMGRVIAEPCERCARRARGLCWSCNNPPVDGSSFCGKCRYQRNKAARLASNRRADRRRSRAERRARAARAYARRRATVLGAKRMRIARARVRKQAPLQFRPCACGGTIAYRTRPPVACGRCYEQLSQTQLTSTRPVVH